MNARPIKTFQDFVDHIFNTLSSPAVDLRKLEAQLTLDVAQIKRQQVHVDEIKRLCHVERSQ